MGTILTKLDASGNKDITYVPANGLAFPLQTKDLNGNPTVTAIVRDVTGLQEDGKAVDPFGSLIQNVQPPTGGGPPPNIPFFGGSYGGASWSQFTNANNYSSGCILDGVRTTCQKLGGQVGNGNAKVDSISTTGTLAEFFNVGLGGLAAATQRGYTGVKDDQRYGLVTSVTLRPHVLQNTIAYFLPNSAGDWADVAWTPTNFLFVDNLNLGPVFGTDPQNPRSDGLGEPPSVESLKLDLAIKGAAAALARDKCRALFGANADPIKLLNDLANGTAGYIRLGVVESEADGQIEFIDHSRMITNPDGTQTQQKTTDKIGITFDSQSQLFKSYSFNPFTPQQQLVAAIIHELGHAANMKYGNGASSILQEDKGNKLLSGKINQGMVIANCIAPALSGK